MEKESTPRNPAEQAEVPATRGLGARLRTVAAESADFSAAHRALRAAQGAEQAMRRRGARGGPEGTPGAPETPEGPGERGQGK